MIQNLIKKRYADLGRTVKAKLRMKCRNCGIWNKLEVEKIFLYAGNSEAKLKVFLPAYLPLKTEKCSKCSQVFAKEKGIIRIKKS